MKEFRTVYMGSPEIAVPALEKLIEDANVIGVVTQPDRPAGRGKKVVSPAVKIVAEKAGIPVMQPVKLRDPDAFEQLASWKPDLIVVMAYGQILRKNVLELPQFGCLNLHASILPRWRGASPIQSAILAGDLETGVSLMKMDAGMDTGPVYISQSLKINPDDNAQTLSDRLSVLAADLLVQSLPDILTGALAPVPQLQAGVTMTKLIKKEDGLLDFSQPAAFLARQVRAYHPWPSAYFIDEGLPVKVCAAHVEDIPSALNDAAAGTRFCSNGFPALITGENALVLDVVHCAGRKQMAGNAFLSGCRNWMDS